MPLLLNLVKDPDEQVRKSSGQSARKLARQRTASSYSFFFSQTRVQMRVEVPESVHFAGVAPFRHEMRRFEDIFEKSRFEDIFEKNMLAHVELSSMSSKTI